MHFQYCHMFYLPMQKARWVSKYHHRYCELNKSLNPFVKMECSSLVLIVERMERFATSKAAKLAKRRLRSKITGTEESFCRQIIPWYTDNNKPKYKIFKLSSASDYNATNPVAVKMTMFPTCKCRNSCSWVRMDIQICFISLSIDQFNIISTHSYRQPMTLKSC